MKAEQPLTVSAEESTANPSMEPTSLLVACPSTTSPSPTEANSGTSYQDGARVNLKTPITLYAQWANIPVSSPTINDINSLTLIYGYSSGSLTADATPPTDTDYDLSYQWYSSSTEGNGSPIDGATSSSYSIPTGQNAGTYFYSCVVTATRQDNGLAATSTSNSVTVYVNKADSTSATVSANNRVYDSTQKPLVGLTGEASGGTMYYALSASEPEADSWTTNIPTAILPGTYTVWSKVKGDSNRDSFMESR